MRCRISRWISIPSLVVLCLLLGQGPARADLSLGFSNGLSGWTTTDLPPGDTGSVTVSNNQATIVESSDLQKLELYTTFVIPTGAQRLQFTLSASADSPYIQNSTPDSFGASLLDPTTLAPIGDFVSGSDSFYTRDIVTDPSPVVLTASGVTLSPQTGLPVVVTLDISSPSLYGQTAELLFRLSGGDDADSLSTVTLSDVQVLGGLSTIPEPSTATLVILGGLGMIGYGRHHRRTARGPSRIAAH